MNRVLALVVLLLLASLSYADDKLREKLVVKELQGGFAGLTGKQWTIDKDGKWQEANVVRQKATLVRKGTLGKKELASLVSELKKYDPATLKSEGKAETNPKVIGVSYGKTSADLTLKPAAELPKPNARTIAGRFAGILAAVKAAIPAEKKK
jgi:hypothetical protein